MECRLLELWKCIVEYTPSACFVECNSVSVGSLYVMLLQALMTRFFLTVIPCLILLIAHGSKCSFETQRSFHVRKDFSPVVV